VDTDSRRCEAPSSLGFIRFAKLHVGDSQHLRSGVSKLFLGIADPLAFRRVWIKFTLEQFPGGDSLGD
jgi:hypothetical protein